MPLKTRKIGNLCLAEGGPYQSLQRYTCKPLITFPLIVCLFGRTRECLQAWPSLEKIPGPTIGSINSLRLCPRSNALKSVASMVLMFSGSFVKIIGLMLTVALSKVGATLEYRRYHISSHACFLFACNTSLIFSIRESLAGGLQPCESAKARSCLHLSSLFIALITTMTPIGTRAKSDRENIVHVKKRRFVTRSAWWIARNKIIFAL